MRSLVKPGRRRFFRSRFIAALFLVFAGRITAQDLPDSIRCDGSIIDVGEIDAKIIAKCGTPTYQTEIVRFVVIHTQYFIDEFRNRTLLDEYAATYDDAASFPSYRPTWTNQNHSHDFLGRSYAGLPGHPRIIRQKTGRHPGTKGHIHWECQVVEERLQRWVYNLGPGSFIRILTMHNGRLVGLEHGGYGY